MKKIVTTMIILSLLSVNFVYANTNEIISKQTQNQLINIKNTELNSVKDYQDTYGGVVYGTVAYVLHKVRIFSIPLCLLALLVSLIHSSVLGIKDMADFEKGFIAMISISTVFVICQIMPLIFAIVVKGWRN